MDPIEFLIYLCIVLEIYEFLGFLFGKLIQKFEREIIEPLPKGSVCDLYTLHLTRASESEYQKYMINKLFSRSEEKKYEIERLKEIH